MNLRAATILAVCAILSQSGCDKNPLGTIESQGHPPLVSNVQLTPAIVRIDSITPSNGFYHLKMVLKARVTDPGGYANIRAVLGEIIDPSGDRAMTVALLDDGVAPDSARGDEVFSAQVDLPVSKSATGLYYPYVTAIDGSGLQSSKVSASLLVYRLQNSPPRITNVNVVDTVRIAIGSTAIIPIYVTAADSDGLGDIKEVYFRSLDSSDPTAHYQLLDDGGETNNGASGDQTAGDGIYSTVIQLPRTSSTKPAYRFQFQARDAAGDTSASVLHTITIANP